MQQSLRLVVASSASFVSALRAESAVAPLLLLSPANPLTLGFPGAPKAEPPPLCKGRCRPVRAAEGLIPRGQYSRAASDYELLNSRAVRQETVCGATIPQSATLTAPFTQRGLCTAQNCPSSLFAALARERPKPLFPPPHAKRSTPLGCSFSTAIYFKYASTALAHALPSTMAFTTRLWPVRQSPQAKIFSTLVW